MRKQLRQPSPAMFAWTRTPPINWPVTAARPSVTPYADSAFVRSARDEALWRWVDPAHARPGEPPGDGARAIPRRTLARLIDRLEQM